MTAEQRRIAIATAVGWTKEQYTHRAGCWISPDGKTGCRSNIALPDFLNDLNAISQAVDTLSFPERAQLIHELDKITARRSEEWFAARCATAKPDEWAEAFLRTKNLWTDQ